MVGQRPEGQVAVRSRRPRPTRRQIIVQMLVGIMILASGVAIGAGGTILLLKDRIIWRTGPPAGRPNPSSIVEDWKAKYDLTDEQVERLKGIFTQRFEARRLRVEAMMKDDQAERERFAKAVKEILSPQQYEKWEHDFKERAEHFRKMRPFGPRGGRRDAPRRGPPRPSSAAAPNEP